MDGVLFKYTRIGEDVKIHNMIAKSYLRMNSILNNKLNTDGTEIKIKVEK